MVDHQIAGITRSRTQIESSPPPSSPPELAVPSLPPLIPDGLCHRSSMKRAIARYIEQDKRAYRAARSLLDGANDDHTTYAILVEYLCNMKLLEQEHARCVRYGPRERSSGDQDSRSRATSCRTLLGRATELRIFTTGIPSQRYQDQDYLIRLLHYWTALNCTKEVKRYGQIWAAVAGRHLPLTITSETAE